MRKTWKRFIALSMLLLVGNSWAAETLENNSKLQLMDCHLDGIKEQVQCGKLTVPENYQQSNGKEIVINFAVIPAIDDSKNKAPLMFLAGGPGQAAVELASMLRERFKEIRKTRDLILVDQRGTGESHPLQCEDTNEQSVYEVLPEDYSEQDIKDCIAQLTGDLSQYNSENAIRDFDAVRAALGHQQIHIYGGSYGTRAGLVYMRLFPQSLKSVILDSVGPIEVPIGLFGQSTARSFNLMLEHCQQDQPCQKAYPNLADEFKQVVTRLKKASIKIPIAHPRLGTGTSFALSHDKFIGTLITQLYGTTTRSLLPLVIHQTFLENYQPLIGLIATTEGSQAIYVGLTMNIVCNEDMPKVSTQMFIDDANNDFGGNTSHKAWSAACPLWPKYSVNDDFYQAVTANIPTLILSGDLDPVTPPSNGDKSAATLPNSHHIISKNNAHIVASTDCAIDIVNEFLETLDPKNVDSSCLDEIPDETFMTSLNGSI